MGFGIGMESARNTSSSSSRDRWCFAPPCFSRSFSSDSWPDSLRALRVTGIPWFAVTTSPFSARPTSTGTIPASRRFLAANTTSTT